MATDKLYIVRFLHQTTTVCPCTLSLRSLYIVRFLHQTTTNDGQYIARSGCISSVSYIKPQLQSFSCGRRAVVYRPFPTSNHNLLLLFPLQRKLYIVRFLHQTTTLSLIVIHSLLLYIVRFLHQTTTAEILHHGMISCISSVSYIKPQHLPHGTW